MDTCFKLVFGSLQQDDKVRSRSQCEQVDHKMQPPACQTGPVSSVQQQASIYWLVVSSHATHMSHDQLC